MELYREFDAAPRKEQSAGVLIRDLIIFNLKLAIDSLKDVLVFQLALIAVGADLVLSRGRRPRYFYGLMALAERLDLWLNLYGASERARSSSDGLFGVSTAGPGSLLSRLEEILRGREAAAEV